MAFTSYWIPFEWPVTGMVGHWFSGRLALDRGHFRGETKPHQQIKTIEKELKNKFLHSDEVRSAQALPKGPIRY